MLGIQSYKELDVKVVASPNIECSNMNIYEEETDSESDSGSEAISLKRPRMRKVLLSDDDDDLDEKTASAKPGSDGNQRTDEVSIDGLLNSGLSTVDMDSESGDKQRRGSRVVILSDDDNEQEGDETSKGSFHSGGSDSEMGSGSDGETSCVRPAKPNHVLEDTDDERPMQEDRAKSKGTRVQKPRRLKKEAIQKIHSESQRLVRESALRLPYHKPKQMTVNDFFSKRPSAGPIKPTKGPARSFKEVVEPTHVQQKDEVDDLPDPFAREVSQVQSNDNLSHQDKDSVDSTESVSINTTAEATSTELPQSLGNPEKAGTSKDVVTTVNSCSSDKTPLEENDVDELKHGDESDSSHGKVTSGDGKPQASLPNNKSPPKVGGLEQFSDMAVLEDRNKSPAIMSTPATAKKQSAAMRLLQGSMDKFRHITPELSGERERVIQLDIETDSVMKRPTGVENLMKRFVKHSDKKKHRPKKTQEVQLSIVKKETSVDGKESLKQENISILLEPDEQEVNPTLKVPGAKLTKLKDTLQQQMKERRELERKKRQEAYNIDNEDMNGQEEEEEAEMSSDDEEDFEPKNRDSEDDDDDYIPEDDFKEKHEFADDEADEDSDDEELDDMEIVPLGDGGDRAPKGAQTRDNDESGDEASPCKKTKAVTRRRIISDDEEEDATVELQTATPCKEVKEIHNETSNISSISSKTSSIKKSDSSSVTHYFNDHGKTMDLFDSTSSLTDVKCTNLTMDEKQTSFNLKDHLSTVTSKTPEPDTTSLENSFEMFPSSIPPYQPQQESVEAQDKKDSFRPFSKAKSELEQNSMSESSTSKFPDLSMPVEDSQDLFRPDTPSLQIPDSQLETETQNFKFSFEEDDTQTQFLDGNGFLRLKSSSGQRPPARKIFDSDNATQGNMDELLGLCSGQFNQTAGSAEVESSQTSFRKGLFSQAQSQDNMNELLGLCSGNFSSKPEDIDPSKPESDNESISSFGLVLDREQIEAELNSDDDEPIILTRKKKRKSGPEADDRDDEELLLAYNSNDEDVEVNKDAFKGVTYGKFAKKKFFEQEAELSGSEGDSDENYDAEDEPDELEMDREVEEQYKDTEKLREEVNEIYMKNIDDEDSRRLRLFKEMYLREGDLHSDKTRVRKFRWKHLEGLEMDLGAGNEKDSDDEEAEEDEKDAQWRLQRHEREQWLKKQEAEMRAKTMSIEEPEEEENSQFAQFMKKVSRTNSKGSSTSQETASDASTRPAEIKEEKVFNSPKPPKMLKHGSFLKRKRQDLEKLASVVKPLNNPGGPKSTRGFIFQSVSNTEPEKTSQVPTVKRTMSMPDTSSPAAPQIKRQKLDRSISQRSSQSIFDHL